MTLTEVIILSWSVFLGNEIGLKVMVSILQRTWKPNTKVKAVEVFVFNRVGKNIAAPKHVSLACGLFQVNYF